MNSTLNLLQKNFVNLKMLKASILSLIAIVLFSPIILITAVCIKAEDHGPVFYRQTRLTKDGELFRLIKFRSMRTDAEKDGVARLSTGDKDDRVTKVGRFIRKGRLDELPQLLNIIKGEMSIVGPRPERPEIAEKWALVAKGSEQQTEIINKYDLPIVYGTDSMGDPEKIDAHQLDDFRYFKKHYGSFRGLLFFFGCILVRLDSFGLFIRHALPAGIQFSFCYAAH